MHKEGFYSSGEFAKKANVTVRTIRFYDKKNLLKPSYVNENGARFYTDADFARLQQILLFKYLGFSLDDIKNITVQLPDGSSMQKLGQGTWKMGEDDRKAEKEVAGLQYGIDLGLSMIDSAEMYADGKAEMIAGRAIQRYDRKDIYLQGLSAKCLQRTYLQQS